MGDIYLGVLYYYHLPQFSDLYQEFILNNVNLSVKFTIVEYSTN